MAKTAKIKKVDWFLIVFILIFIGSFVLRIKQISGDNIAFTSDQARDSLELRHLFISHQPKLLGPVTDIIGLHLGPFWYYFLFPVFVISRDPYALVIFAILFFHFSIWSVFSYLRYHKQPKLAFIFSCLLLISPASFLTTRYSFNANAIFYFVPIVITLLYLNISYFWTGLLIGITFQLQSAFAPVIFIFALLWYFLERNNRKSVLVFLFGFAITFLPQLISEIIRHFPMTRAVISEIFGQTNYLNEKLSWGNLLSDRLNYLQFIFSQSFYLNYKIIAGLFLLDLLTLIKTKKYQFTLLFLSVLIVFYLLFPHHLKDWYLFGAIPFIVFSFSQGLSCFKNQYLLTIIILVTFIISTKPMLSYISQIELNPSHDPSNLKNQKEIIKTVYQQSENKPFAVYVYQPSVYDYPYQYLFWYLGNEKYHQLPAKISYLPNIPEYIRDNHLFWPPNPSLPEKTFLIIQHDTDNPQRETDWRKKFGASISSTPTPFGITIELINPL